MNDFRLDRRNALGIAGAAMISGVTDSFRPLNAQDLSAQEPAPSGVKVLNPRDRVPLSFIIDDSTCLVNMGHFCMPQFAEAWPQRDIYKQPWRDWPREIPDAFVTEFGEWCAQHGVKGKYSIVPYPACVGWLDRNLPGWSRQDLENSLSIVRDLMVPNWDIHPEMISHTRVIDLKTGRPMEGANAATMENSYPQTDISTDHLTSYLAYALQILKNCGLPCEGITTPGGFGNRVKDKLPVAVGQAVRDVYGCELPHYFKYVKTGTEPTTPTLEFNGEKTLANATVNVPAGTGDWFGGWEGSVTSEPDRYCNADASSGRMVELIRRGQPAVMLCHWPGMYCNGTKSGFQAFQRVVLSLAASFSDQTLWMKVSEIGRYWATKELAQLKRTDDNEIEIKTPLQCDDFTISVSGPAPSRPPQLVHQQTTTAIESVATKPLLTAGTFVADQDRTLYCLSLPKGTSKLQF